MRRHQFKLHLLPRITLFPLATITRKLYVADFIRLNHATLGQISNRDIKGSQVLNAPVRRLRLYGFHLLLIQNDFRRRRLGFLLHKVGVCSVLHVGAYFSVIQLRQICSVMLNAAFLPDNATQIFCLQNRPITLKPML